MRPKEKKVGIFLSVFVILLVFLTACSHTTSEKTEKNVSEKKTVTKKTKKEDDLTIVSAVASQDNQMLVVDTKMKNSSSSAKALKPESFALVSNSTVLSPDDKSEIPNQIPAKTEAEFKIMFDPKSIEGDVPLRLAYQPINQSEVEQFFTIGNFTIKKVVATEQPKSNEKPSTTGTPASAQTPVQLPKSKPIDSNQIELQIQIIEGIRVIVPVGWIKSPQEGGDFSGAQFINPKDGNEQMKVITSGCAGCGYPDADTTQPPNPLELIPEQSVHSYVFKDGLSAGYTFYLTGNPYTGNGVVKMKPGDGYGFVEIVLPDSMKAIATKVLNSIQF